MPNQHKLIEWRAREAVAKAAEQAVKSFKAETAALEEQLLEQFADEGVHSIKVDSPTVDDLRMAYNELAQGQAVGIVNASDALGDKQTIFLWSQWFGVACRKVNEHGEEIDEPDQAKFIAGMKAAGLEALVSENINYNVLGAWVREQIPAGELQPHLPAEVAAFLTTAQKHELRARKS